MLTKLTFIHHAHITRRSIGHYLAPPSLRNALVLGRNAIANPLPIEERVCTISNTFMKIHK